MNAPEPQRQTPVIDAHNDSIVAYIRRGNLGRIAGVDHVGFGSDFDGGGDLLPDAAAYADLSQALADRGYAPKDIAGIMGGNLLRLLEQAIG